MGTCSLLSTTAFFRQSSNSAFLPIQILGSDRVAVSVVDAGVCSARIVVAAIDARNTTARYNGTANLQRVLRA
jgi:hypothetical protein